MEDFNDLLLIIIGSLLAILSPGLIDWIRRAHARKPIKLAIEVELDELRYTLAALSYLLRSHLSIVDHDFLRWQEAIEAAYKGPDQDPENLRMLQELLRQTPTELQQVQLARAQQRKSLTVKQYRLPFLSSQLALLHDLPPDFQRRVLQINAQLALLNDDVPYLIHQHDLTFTQISSENHAIVRQNIADGYRRMAKCAKELADRITQLLPLGEKGDRIN